MSEASNKLKLYNLNELCLNSITLSLSNEKIFDSYEKLILKLKKESLKEAFINSFVDFSNELIFDENFNKLDKKMIVEILKRRNEKYNYFLRVKENENGEITEEDQNRILKTF